MTLTLKCWFTLLNISHVFLSFASVVLLAATSSIKTVSVFFWAMNLRKNRGKKNLQNLWSEFLYFRSTSYGSFLSRRYIVEIREKGKWQFGRSLDNNICCLLSRCQYCRLQSFWEGTIVLFMLQEDKKWGRVRGEKET